MNLIAFFAPAPVFPYGKSNITYFVTVVKLYHILMVRLYIAMFCVCGNVGLRFAPRPNGFSKQQIKGVRVTIKIKSTLPEHLADTFGRKCDNATIEFIPDSAK